jgi:hypothetical protein
MFPKRNEAHDVGGTKVAEGLLYCCKQLSWVPNNYWTVYVPYENSVIFHCTYKYSVGKSNRKSPQKYSGDSGIYGCKKVERGYFNLYNAAISLFPFKKQCAKMSSAFGARFCWPLIVSQLKFLSGIRGKLFQTLLFANFGRCPAFPGFGPDPSQVGSSALDTIYIARGAPIKQERSWFVLVTILSLELLHPSKICEYHFIYQICAQPECLDYKILVFYPGLSFYFMRNGQELGKLHGPFRWCPVSEF